MKTAGFIILILISISCRKEESHLIPPNNGPFHISGKLFKDCSNTPSQNRSINIGQYVSDCFGCWGSHFVYLDSTHTDSSGNFYFEYMKNEEIYEIETDFISQKLPYCQNVENLICYDDMHFIVVVNLNYIRPMSVSDTLQIGYDYLGNISLYYPFQNGHLITFKENMHSTSKYFDSNVSLPYTKTISYLLNDTVMKFGQFLLNKCDTTIAVLNIE